MHNGYKILQHSSNNFFQGLYGSLGQIDLLFFRAVSQRGAGDMLRIFFLF